MAAEAERTPILDIENVGISFFTRAGEIPAVMDFSCRIGPGEAMGLVGESGCGKSTVALGIMGYLGRSGRIIKGAIRFKGRDLATMSGRELRRLRGAEIAMIYQEPMASLNPAMRIGRQLMEVPMLHAGVGAREARRLALEIVASVHLPDPERILRSYPHQLSGGQQQRIVIAMALMSKPSLLILDEPTTALDVTVEAGIVELVRELGERHGTSMLFISHNLGLILETCDRLCVMYSGEAVETGSVVDVFDQMQHPYTQALFRSMPLPGSDKNTRPLAAIPGSFPLPHERPPGCNFGPRCGHFVGGRCDAHAVGMVAVGGRERHESRCLRVAEIDWDAPAPRRQRTESAGIGEVVLKVDDLKKHYEVAGSALFAGGCVIRQPKAYPVYDDAYQAHVATVRTSLASYPNLHLVGRNGMHKYNNQDHAMMTAMLTVENILAGTARYDAWQVNEDAEYLEEDAERNPAGGPQPGRRVPSRVSPAEPSPAAARQP